MPSLISNLLIVHGFETPHLSSFGHLSLICSLFAMLKTNMSSFCHLSLLIVYGVKTSHLSSFCHFSLICSFFTMLKPHLSSVPSFISNLLIVHDVKTPHLSSFRYFSPVCSLFMMSHLLSKWTFPCTKAHRLLQYTCTGQPTSGSHVHTNYFMMNLYLCEPTNWISDFSQIIVQPALYYHT